MKNILIIKIVVIINVNIMYSGIYYYMAKKNHKWRLGVRKHVQCIVHVSLKKLYTQF